MSSLATYTQIGLEPNAEGIRQQFAAAHGYKLTADELLTVEEFIDLTKGSYGGDIIRRLREAYNKKGGEAT